MIRRSRHRLKVALLVILCLLFQQAALAAYLCPIDQVHATPAVMAANCAEMDMTQAPDHTVLCDKHCNPDRVLAADVASVSVPPLALSPIALLTADVQLACGLLQDEPAIARSDPPPRLRFCSLLI
jgi:hypothetical protein